MALTEYCPTVATAQPALELISLARLSPEVACHTLRKLLLANPRYFGRITGSSFKAVLRIEEDTTYESLSGVSYDPILEQLEATITLNRSAGYSNAACEGGTFEYVRFYLSFDGGFSWRDQGLRSVEVFDVPGAAPAQHMLAVGIGPARTFCFMRKPPLMRAILSWNSPPPADAPDWKPVWGNLIETRIKIAEFNRAELTATEGTDAASETPVLF
jgi:hypothetical protein